MREHARRWLLCAVLALVALVALPQAALAEAKPFKISASDRSPYFHLLTPLWCHAIIGPILFNE